jgi:uncharacterized protein YycO
MILQPLDCIIYRGYWWNPMTYFVGLRTSTFWTHAGVVLTSGGLCMEAKEGGVQQTHLNTSRTFKVVRYIPGFASEIEDKLFDWVISKKGCDYKYESYLGYIFGIKTAYLQDPNEFVCVELFSEMFNQNGINIWGCEKPTYTYPSDILQNPNFEEVTS